MYTLKCLRIVDNIILNNPVRFNEYWSTLTFSHSSVLSSAQWMSSALLHSGYCTIQWMFLHQWENLWYTHYPTSDSSHIHQDWKIECCDEEYAYTHILVAHLRFGKRQLLDGDQVEQVVFQTKVKLLLVCAAWVSLVMVNLSLYAASLSPNSLLHQIGKAGRHQFDFHEPQPGVFLLQP